MRLKLSFTAVLLLALTFTSAAFADVVTFTRLDRFDQNSTFGITKSDSWYNYAVSPNTISNEVGGDCTNSVCAKKVLGTDNEEGETFNVAEIRNINATNSDVAIGMDLRGNGVNFNLSQCTGGFTYDYKGVGHYIYFEVKPKEYDEAVPPPVPSNEWEYVSNYCNNSAESAGSSSWKTVTIAPSSYLHRCSDKLGSWSDKPSIMFDNDSLDRVISFKWKVVPNVTDGNLKIKNLKCIGASIFMEPMKNISGTYGKSLSQIGTLASLLAEDEDDNPKEPYAERYRWKTPSTLLTDPEHYSIANPDGTYTYFKTVDVTYTFEGGSSDGRITVWITKADAADIAPADLTTVYVPGKKLSSIELPISSSAAPTKGTWSWVGNPDVGDATEPSTKNFKAIYSGDVFYNATDAAGIDVPVKVLKANYDAAPVKDYRVVYGKNVSDITPEIGEGWSWKETGAVVGDVGPTTLHALFAGNDNYNSVTGEGLPLTVTIDKTQPSVTTWPTPSTPVTFGQTLAEVALTGGSAVGGEFKWENPAQPVGTVGNHTYKVVYVESAGNINYDWADRSFSTTKEITVGKATSGLTAAAVSLQIAKTDESNYTFDLRNIRVTGSKGAPGALTYSFESSDLTNTQGALEALPTKNGTVITYKKGSASEASKTASLIVHIGSDNYTDITATITFTTTDYIRLNIAGLTEVPTYTYQEGTARAGYTGIPTAEGYSGDYTISYSGTDKGGTAYGPLPTAPTQAGTYSVSIEPTTAGYFSNYTYAFEIEQVTVATPTGFTAKYGQVLSDVLPVFSDPKGTWTWASPTEDVGAIGTHEYFANFVPNDAVNYKTLTSVAISVTVGKGDGAAVLAPTVASTANSITANSITINAVAAPSNGQTVEYGISRTTAAPTTWQSTLTFTGLVANTKYYVFARAAANANYNAGTASSFEVTTRPSGGVTPIRAPQVAISNLRVRTIAGAIELENLPNNAKVDVYNLLGKRIHSSNSVNSQLLKIQVQTGMYIVRVSVGSETKILRVSMK